MNILESLGLAWVTFSREGNLIYVKYKYANCKAGAIVEKVLNLKDSYPDSFSNCLLGYYLKYAQN